MEVLETRLELWIMLFYTENVFIFNIIVIIIIIIITTYSLLLQVHIIFQRQFATECDLVITFSVSFSQGHSSAASFFPSLLSLLLSFLQQCVLKKTVPIKMWRISLLFLVFNVCRIFLSSLILRTIFSHDRPNWSSPCFSSTTFQNFPGISDLFPEVSKFQHNITLCSKYSFSLAYSVKLSPGCWWKVFFLLNAAFVVAYILHHLSCYPNTWTVPYSTALSYL